MNQSFRICLFDEFPYRAYQISMILVELKNHNLPIVDMMLPIVKVDMKEIIEGMSDTVLFKWLK